MRFGPIDGTVPVAEEPSISIWNFLNIHGPSEPIETACSSSLVAVHRAVRAIQAGDCGIAIAGGVNAIVSPGTFSSDIPVRLIGKCFAAPVFTEHSRFIKADMHIRRYNSLKTLSDAERDGDRIYAVIRGTAENHGGRAASLTSPNPKAQTEVMIKAMRLIGCRYSGFLIKRCKSRFEPVDFYRISERRSRAVVAERRKIMAEGRLPLHRRIRKHRQKS
jgi:hypothetical protein